MSSRKGKGKSKKKNPFHSKKRRRRKNLWEKSHPAEESYIKRKNPVFRFQEGFKKTKTPDVTRYVRTNIQLEDEDYIKAYIKALNEDIVLYDNIRERYVLGGDLMEQMTEQINRHFLKLEEALSTSRISYSELNKFEEEFEICELELNSLGFYD
jgi:hypothetical protein